MTYFTFLALVIGVLIIIILFRYGVPLQRNNWLLVVCLFCLLTSIIFTWLIGSQMMRKVPGLTRMGNIFGYLLYPALYLFIRNTFYPGKLWRRADYLLLIPCVFYVIDMMPFFLLSHPEKIAVMYSNYIKGREIYRYREGWISPPVFHFFFRAIWSFALHVAIGILIFRNWQYVRQGGDSSNRNTFRFLVSLTVLFLPLTIVVFVGSLWMASWWKMSFFTMALSIPLLSVGIFFLFSPGILYGFRPLRFTFPDSIADDPDTLKANESVTLQPEPNAAISKAACNKDLEAQREQLLRFMKEKSPFLQKGLTIHLLSQQCGIPVYVLSSIVNNELKTNFSSWINKYRIAHFIYLCENDENCHRTAEKLAGESGFTGRITFHNAFKREMGTTPGEYLKNRINE